MKKQYKLSIKRIIKFEKKIFDGVPLKGCVLDFAPEIKKKTHCGEIK